MATTTKKRRKQSPQVFIRPQIAHEDLDAFRAACKENGETMTSMVRRFIMKIARGDRELLNRIVT